MVFIGVRDYGAQYPEQSGLFDDDFSFNAILTTYSANTGLFNFIKSRNSDSQTRTVTVSNSNYHAVTRMETAHVFCGYLELKADGPPASSGSFYGFRTLNIEISDPFEVTIQHTRGNFRLQEIGLSCTMFTAVQPSCEQANTPLVLDGEPTSAAVPTTGQATFSSAPFAAHVGSVYTGSAAAGTLLSIQQTATEATIFTYTLLYVGVMSSTGYEGVVHFIGESNVAFNAKVEVFGTVVFDGSITLIDNLAIETDTKEFALLNTGTSSTVVITIEMQGPVP